MKEKLKSHVYPMTRKTNKSIITLVVIIHIFSNIHCSAREFEAFHLKYDPDMAKHNFTFHEGEIEKIKELIGNRDKIILFFLGHENYLYSPCEY